MIDVPYSKEPAATSCNRLHKHTRTYFVCQSAIFSRFGPRSGFVWPHWLLVRISRLKAGHVGEPRPDFDMNTGFISI